MTNESVPAAIVLPSRPEPGQRTRSAIAGAGRFGRFVGRIPAVALLLAIRLYQRTLSPALPILTLGGCVCRFAPTCSHYAADAIRAHGAIRGAWLAARRLAKCTPLHPGGIDPVPARPRPTCRSAS